MIFFQVAAVAAGASAGALARWCAGLWLNARWQGFPLGTLLVNLVGGLLIGMALEWFGRQPNELLKLMLVTGFLGGLTTFSSFGYDTILLMQQGEVGRALLNIGANVVLGLAAVWLGFAGTRAIL